MNKVLPLAFPYKGLNELGAYDQLTPDYAISALNVRPFASDNGRLEGGQRDGLGKWASLPVGTGEIRAIKQLSLSQQTGLVSLWADSFGSEADNHYTTTQPANAAAYDAATDGLIGADYYIVSNKAGSTSHLGHYFLMYKTSSDTVKIEFTWVVGTRVAGGTSRDEIYIVFGDNAYIDAAPYRFRAVDMNAVGSSCDFFKADGTDSLLQDTSPGGWSAGDTVAVTVTFAPSGVTIAVAGHGSKTYATPVGYNYSNLVGLENFLYLNFPPKIGSVEGGVISNLTISAQRDSIYTPRVLLVEGANVKKWTSAGYSTPTNGTAALAATGEVSVAQAYGKAYLADGGAVVKQYDPATDTVGTLTAGAGSITAGAQLVTLYSGRLVLTRVAADPRNWFMSKVGDPTGWDYADETSVGAVSGNDGLQAGLIGDIITAFVPHQDNYALIGCPNSTFVMKGDPKAGGSVELVSAQVGIAGPKAWCQSPDGAIYFISQNGLYRYSRALENISGNRIATTLDNIDFSITNFELEWNLRDQCVYIVARPTNGGAATVLVWDARTDSFWKDSYPAAMGPSAMGNVYFGTNQLLLFGGADSYLRRLTATSLTDDGTAISSSFRTAPVCLSDEATRGRIIEQVLTFGRTTSTLTNAVYNWYTGDSALAAATAVTPTHSGTLALASSAIVADRTRIRAAYASFEIANAVSAKTWAFSRGRIVVSPAGKNRFF